MAPKLPLRTVQVCEAWQWRRWAGNARRQVRKNTQCLQCGVSLVMQQRQFRLHESHIVIAPQITPGEVALIKNHGRMTLSRTKARAQLPVFAGLRVLVQDDGNCMRAGDEARVVDYCSGGCNCYMSISRM